MIRILPGGGRATGPHAGGFHYPFASPELAIRRLLADVYVSFEAAVDAALPLSIKWLYGFAEAFWETGTYPGDLNPPDYEPVHAADVIITDADDATVFDSRAADLDAYAARDFGGRLRIHEWLTDTATCRVVQHTAFEDTEDVIEFPASILPAQGELDARTWEQLPQRVQSLLTGILDAQGDVKLLAGYNLTFEAAALSTTGLQRRKLLVSPHRRTSRRSRSEHAVYPDCAAARLRSSTTIELAPKSAIIRTDRVNRHAFLERRLDFPR